MGQCVHSDMEVCDVDSHGLLPHSRLVRVSGRLQREVEDVRV